jgi:hypothetical protein
MGTGRANSTRHPVCRSPGRWTTRPTTDSDAIARRDDRRVRSGTGRFRSVRERVRRPHGRRRGRRGADQRNPRRGWAWRPQAHRCRGRSRHEDRYPDQMTGFIRVSPRTGWSGSERPRLRRLPAPAANTTHLTVSSPPSAVPGARAARRHPSFDDHPRHPAPHVGRRQRCRCRPAVARRLQAAAVDWRFG